jgi:hypothetical protein
MKRSARQTVSFELYLKINMTDTGPRYEYLDQFVSAPHPIHQQPAPQECCHMEHEVIQL